MDVCHGGCGGVWFDAAQLIKVNAEQRARPQRAVNVRQAAGFKPDAIRTRRCPHCADIVLHRRLYSLGSGVEMDCCPRCDGIWLDHGELEVIQEEINPQPRPRHVVQKPARSIPINFAVLKQVETLRISPPRPNRKQRPTPQGRLRNVTKQPGTPARKAV